MHTVSPRRERAAYHPRMARHSLRWFVVAVAVGSSSSALAQAPGEVPSAPVGYGPPPPVLIAPAPPSVMQHRFAIGISLGGAGYAPSDGSAADGEDIGFSVAELELRFRLNPRIELLASFAGGREAGDNGEAGDLATGSFAIAARYRFLPEQPWSWWLMGGLGGQVIAPHQSSTDTRDAATRPLGLIGIGVERRFHRFGIQAELRAVGLGSRSDADDTYDVPTSPGTPGTALYADDLVYADSLSGGQFTVGASFYF